MPAFNPNDPKQLKQALKALEQLKSDDKIGSFKNKNLLDLTEKDLEQARRKTARAMHPDKHPENLEEYTRKFQEFEKNYEVLKHYVNERHLNLLQQYQTNPELFSQYSQAPTPATPRWINRRTEGFRIGLIGDSIEKMYENFTKTKESSQYADFYKNHPPQHYILQSPPNKNTEALHNLAKNALPPARLNDLRNGTEIKVTVLSFPNAEEMDKFLQQLFGANCNPLCLPCPNRYTQPQSDKHLTDDPSLNQKRITAPISKFQTLQQRIQNKINDIKSKIKEHNDDKHPAPR